MFGIKNKNWLRKFLSLTEGIPSAQTYERVISLLEPDEINKICVEFSNLLTEADRKKKEMYHLYTLYFFYFLYLLFRRTIVYL